MPYIKEQKIIDRIHAKVNIGNRKISKSTIRKILKAQIKVINTLMLAAKMFRVSNYLLFVPLRMLYSKKALQYRMNKHKSKPKQDRTT